MNDLKIREVNCYLHLNTSFANHLGILDGKLASVLYFASLDDLYYRENISYSFLEEILNQIHIRIPLTYGSGIAGMGVLLSYLKQKKIVEEDPGELLAAVEPLLIQKCREKMFEEINLSSGICGLGLYFLSRIKDYIPVNNNCNFHLYQFYRSCVFNIVDHISDRLSAYSNLKPKPHLFTIWHGLPGIYFYLHKVYCIDLPDSSVKELTQRLENIFSQWLHLIPPCWEMIETYFTFSQESGSSQLWLTSFKEFIDKISKAPIDFYQAAWYAMLLRIIGEQHHLKKAVELSHNLEDFVNGTLLRQGLKNLFPFYRQKSCVQIGLERGLCGTALPLLSLKTGDYEWLSLFGVELKKNMV